MTAAAKACLKITGICAVRTGGVYSTCPAHNVQINFHFIQWSTVLALVLVTRYGDRRVDAAQLYCVLTLCVLLVPVSSRSHRGCSCHVIGEVTPPPRFNEPASRPVTGLLYRLPLLPRLVHRMVLSEAHPGALLAFCASCC